MTNVNHTAVLGAGVIGASWTALFLASGRSVAVFDVSDTTEAQVRGYVEQAWPVLKELGLTEKGNPDRVSFHRSAAEAVDGAQFVQESVPERINIKHELFAAIEPALAPDAIVASSASGLTLSEMQAGWKNPGRFVLGHPFNPPHLIPLVEVMGNGRTAGGVVEAAERFYASVGKVTIRVNREVPGHVANRLQAAVWREAIHLVKTGVASVEDVDKAMWAGPGLRWAAMGPTMLFHLGAGEGGLAAFCQRYTDSFNRWWDDLGVLHLDPTMSATLVQGVTEEARGKPVSDLSGQRDALITATLKAITPLRAR
ncbi:MULTISPECIES: 3-hydroxyacyl-CoA dehydrogenase NAD-binding domain-containing protein [unclassified Mesorhizobium]|uniref:3-hydroxyacyl-CoA dehydrogenase NAD-binding domain-containing protein n=1 Tax=unclassified Mesorhizobium TaxID=325217 RepID=UPI0009655843|nr:MULTISPECIES: 3-hydroxyacyl-CoA dehydrogenase NAD-binding domain-containing protein [unclassified Mesorhizobium]MBN9253149.1 3-hydroxyacyl-CoA dehydrogenase [Mesorhizobium sp.]OJX81372.1 MAG: 3-hydroxyacyl-CoA dehydrogenase [Mesorhizobium sp. 65-26]